MKIRLQGLDRLFAKRQRETPVLGARELELMKLLWRGEALSAQQLLHADLDDSISLSTVQSTLERLYRKGLLERKKTGRSYTYSASISQSAFISQLLGDIAEKISDGDMAPMISGFMSFCEQEAPESVSSDLRDLLGNLPTKHDD